MRIFGGFFIGIVLLVIGATLLLNTIFNLNVHTFKLIVGILFVSMGIFVLFNGFGVHDTSNIVFKEGTIRAEEVGREYNIIFASGVIDLSKIELDNEVKRVKINTIFSQGQVILNAEIPAMIRASTAFGELKLGGSTLEAFGSRKFRIGDIDTH